MQISIIIPVLNEAERIGEQVRYLFENGGPAVAEILVVDADSQDGTVSLATGAGASVLPCPVCSRAAQMNTGARAARGEVLYFVHADTVPPPSFADDIRASLEAGHLMGCYRYKFDSPRFLLKINAFFNRFHYLWCQGGDKTFFIKKEIFEKMGGYDEHYVIMEEYDFLRRAMRLYQLHIIPKYVVASSRKYIRNGWLRVQYANAVVFGMFRRRAAPEEMKRVYKQLLR